MQKICQAQETYQLTAHFDAFMDDPDLRLYIYYPSKGGRIQTRYSNPDDDRIAEAQRQEFDLAKGKELVRQAQLKLIEGLTAGLDSGLRQP